MIEIGQKYSIKNVDLPIPKLTRQNIREVLVQDAKKRLENQLALKRNEDRCTFL